MKVGILGAGFMGGMHLACYQALADLGVQVTAIADTNLQGAKRLADQVGAQVFTSGMEMMDQADVDAVDICLPVHMHTAHAVYAMEKGFDVFCEKPAAIRDDELDLLLETQRRTAARCMIGHVVRFMPEYAWLKTAVQENRYGRFLSGTFYRVSPHPGWSRDNWLHNPNFSGGVAYDMHMHDVDYVRYLLGEPDKIQAAAYRDEQGLIQQIMVLYNYVDDVAVSVEAGWDYPAEFAFDAGFRVKLQDATVVLKNNVLTVYPNAGKTFEPELKKHIGQSVGVKGNISDLGGYYNELKYFVEGVQGKNDLSVSSLVEAAQSIRLIHKNVQAAGGLITKNSESVACHI